LVQPDVVLHWYGCKIVGAAEGCASEHAIVGGPGLGGARESARNTEGIGCGFGIKTLVFLGPIVFECSREHIPDIGTHRTHATVLAAILQAALVKLFWHFRFIFVHFRGYFRDFVRASSIRGTHPIRLRIGPIVPRKGELRAMGK
jgi:hypothetical protein